eukprot:g4825.t1
MQRQIRYMQTFNIVELLLTLVILFLSIYFVAATEWNCAATSSTGSFTRSMNCTISGSNHVSVSNMLEIVGSNADMSDLITITAATNKRHFHIDGANDKLVLRYLKLVGGDVSSYSAFPDYNGGSIHIYVNGGELNLYSSIISNNKAYNGGGIYSRDDANDKRVIINIYNSIIKNNEGTGSGGGILIVRTNGTIINTTINNNIAGTSNYGGGGMEISSSDLTMDNVNILNNTAVERGGGLYILGDNNIASNISIVRTRMSHNKISSSTTTSTDGGGALYLKNSVNVIIRETSFNTNRADNNRGHEIYTLRDSTDGTPAISIVNTYFSDSCDDNCFYEDNGAAAWTTCSKEVTKLDVATAEFKKLGCNSVDILYGSLNTNPWAKVWQFGSHFITNDYAANGIYYVCNDTSASGYTTVTFDIGSGNGVGGNGIYTQFMSKTGPDIGDLSEDCYSTAFSGSSKKYLWHCNDGQGWTYVGKYTYFGVAYLTQKVDSSTFQCEDNGYSLYHNCLDNSNVKLGMQCKPRCPIPASGVVQITSDCVLYNQIVVTTSLNVTGVPDANGVLPKIIGGGSNRLFKVESGGELVVKYLNLTGGFVAGTDVTDRGGAIHVNGGSLISIGSHFNSNKAEGTGWVTDSTGYCNAGGCTNSQSALCATNTALGCYVRGFLLPINDITCTYFDSDGTTTSLNLAESKMLCEKEPNCVGLVTWDTSNLIRIVSKITNVVTDSNANCIKYYGKGNHIYTQYDATIKLLNTHFDSDSQNFGGFQQNNFPGYTRPDSCSDAPNQCEDNGYTNAVCTTRQNPDEGVICTKNCTPGSYKTGIFNHTCAPCSSGTLTRLWNQYQCQTWSDCTTGQYISTNGTSSSDRVCSSCSPGKYTASTNAFACTDWADCAAGEYISTNGTSSSDRVCSGCELGKYTGFSNSFACTDWKNCIAGEYISTNGTSSFDRVCSSCSPGKYTASTNAFACTDWADCAAGEYISTNGTSSSDRVCSGCELGKYTGFSNSFACTDWKNCIAGEYISTNGTSSFDRVCSSCSPGKYTASTNAFACTDWADCAAGEYISTNGTSSSDRVCSGCELGKYSVSTNAYFCTNWTDCVAGQKIASNGTISANRKCTACSSGQYSTTTNEFSCTNWTDCKLSEIEIVAGSTKRDRVCASSESPSPTAESPSPSGNTPSSSESTVNSQSPSESVTKATPSPEGTIKVTPSPNSDIGSPSSESQAGDAVDSHIYSTSLSTQKQPTYSTKRRTPAFNRESLTVEQVIGISGGTFLFLILLTYAAECVDGQIAARKRKELKLRKAESKENKT